MGLCNSCCFDGELTNDGDFIDLSSVQPSTEESLLKAIDVNSQVFQGASILQKFTHNDNLEQRFIWVDFTNHTIHLSTFENKERRHKEANLADVISLKAGLPTKIAKQSDTGEMEDKCMTLNFKRGGNIDLMLDSKESRNLWYHTLRKIVEHAKATNN